MNASIFQVTSVSWKENELNMVDTPGHADFGGEVRFFIEIVPISLELFFLSTNGNKLLIC